MHYLMVTHVAIWIFMTVLQRCHHFRWIWFDMTQAISEKQGLRYQFEVNQDMKTQWDVNLCPNVVTKTIHRNCHVLYAFCWQSFVSTCHYDETRVLVEEWLQLCVLYADTSRQFVSRCRYIAGLLLKSRNVRFWGFSIGSLVRLVIHRKLRLFNSDWTLFPFGAILHRSSERRRTQNEPYD